MKRLLIYILFALAFASASRSASLSDGGQGGSVFDYFFFEALRQNNARNYDAAFELYNFCITLNPNSAPTLYELSSLNHYLRNDSLAIVQMEKAVELSPDNYWYKDQLVKLYFSNRRTMEAQETLEQMAEQFPEKSDVLMMLLDLYASNSDYENMIKTLEKIEVKEGKSEQLSLEKFRIYVQNKDEKSAFREMRALADEYPNDVRYQVLIGDLYLDQDKPTEAIKIYNKVAEKEPDNINLALSMLSYYEKVGPDSLYDKQLEKLVTHPSLDDDNRLSLVSTLTFQGLQQNKDSVRILRMLEKALTLPQKDARMYELYARYMVTKNMSSDKVKPALYKMLELDPESELARNQLLAYAIEEEDTMSIIRVCKPAVEYTADNPVYYYYLGLAYYQTDSVAAGIETFKKGIVVNNAKAEKDLTLTTNMYTLLGDLYHKAGQDDKCFEMYDSCLIYKSDDALVLNNYAYYLSLKKKDLNRAETMSRRSLELDKDNPTYVDTLAWILFMQKRYDEAKEQMDRAVELFGDSINDDDNDSIRSHVKQINEKVKNR